MRFTEKRPYVEIKNQLNTTSYENVIIRHFDNPGVGMQQRNSEPRSDIQAQETHHGNGKMSDKVNNNGVNLDLEKGDIEEGDSVVME